MSRITPASEKPADAKGQTGTAPAGWLEALERSEDQLARGETLPLEPVLERLRATIARMDAKRAGASET